MSPIKRHIVLAILQILQLMHVVCALNISFSLSLQCGAFLDNFGFIWQLICSVDKPALLHGGLSVATEQILLDCRRRDQIVPIVEIRLGNRLLMRLPGAGLR